MLKQTVTFKNFDGVEETEDLYFHLSLPDLVDMEAEHEEGIGEYLEGVVKSGDNQQLMIVFKDLIRRAYGIRSEDGKRFERSPEISNNFMQTFAYEAFFSTLISSADSAGDFFNGILSTELLAALESEKKKTGEKAAPPVNKNVFEKKAATSESGAPLPPGTPAP